jgi:hypothetical protein
MHQPFQSPTLRPRFHWFASIRTQMTLAFALLAALMFTLLAAMLLAGVPGTSFKGWQGQAKEEVLNNLSLVADLKKERLIEWISTRRKIMQLLAGNEVISEQVAELQASLGRMRAQGMAEDQVWRALEQSALYQASVQ